MIDPSYPFRLIPRWNHDPPFRLKPHWTRLPAVRILLDDVLFESCGWGVAEIPAWRTRPSRHPESIMIRELGLAARPMLVVVLVLLAGACGTKPVQTVVREKAPAVPSATAANLTRSALLGPGDQVDIFVWGYNDFSRRATVNFSGLLPYPILGELPVARKSVAQVEEEVRVALTDYIKDPIVRVSVASTRPMKIHVLGEVKAPGVYAMSTPNTALTEAIGQAGGMTSDARPSGVIVVRDTGKQIEIHTVDFHRITRAGDLDSNLVLAEGDVVYVPVAYLADIAREARRVTDVLTTLLFVEQTTILFESFLKALTHSDTRQGATQTTIIAR